MNWQTPVTKAPAHDACPHCGTIKPEGFTVCRPCWREVPWELKRDLWTAQGIAHLHEHKNTLSPFLSPAACAERVQAALAAVFGHLRLHSSAL